MKITMYEIKNTVYGVNGRLDIAEERLMNLKAIEMIQMKHRKRKQKSRKRTVNCRKNSRDFRWTIWIPEEEQQVDGKKTRRNNKPKLSKLYEKFNSQIQKSSKNTKHKNMKRVIPKQFIIKLGRKNNNNEKTSNTIDI